MSLSDALPFMANSWQIMGGFLKIKGVKEAGAQHDQFFLE